MRRPLLFLFILTMICVLNFIVQGVPYMKEHFMEFFIFLTVGEVAIVGLDILMELKKMNEYLLRSRDEKKAP